MKTLIVTASFPRIGTRVRDGIETYVETLARVLLAAGVEVRVVEYDPRPDGGDPTQPVAIDQVKLKRIPLISSLLPNLAEAWQLARAVRRLDRREHFDEIEGANDRGLMAFVAPAFGNRFWMHLHVSFRQRAEMNQKKPSWGSWFTARLDGRAVRLTENLVTHSLKHAEAMTAEYGIQGCRIAIVPHAVDGPREASAPDQIQTVAYLGELDRRKGIDLFLKAAVRIIRQDAKIEFLVIGHDAEDGQWPPEPGVKTRARTGTWKSHFEAHCASEEIKAGVHFLGPIDSADLRALWPKIDLVIVPSRYESFGLVAIEAFAWGKPLVVTDRGALPEVVASGALVVKPDPEEIASAVLAIASNPDLAQRLSREGRRLYQARYSLDNLGASVLGLYDCFRYPCSR